MPGKQVVAQELVSMQSKACPKCAVVVVNLMSLMLIIILSVVPFRYKLEHTSGAVKTVVSGPRRTSLRGKSKPIIRAIQRGKLKWQ